MQNIEHKGEKMLEEFPKEIIDELRNKDHHFDAIITKHDELDKLVTEVEEGREHMDDLELEKLKLEKLKLKDEAYYITNKYMKEKGLK